VGMDFTRWRSLASNTWFPVCLSSLMMSEIGWSWLLGKSAMMSHFHSLWVSGYLVLKFTSGLILCWFNISSHPSFRLIFDTVLICTFSCELWQICCVLKGNGEEMRKSLGPMVYTRSMASVISNLQYFLTPGRLCL